MISVDDLGDMIEAVCRRDWESLIKELDYLEDALKWRNCPKAADRVAHFAKLVRQDLIDDEAEAIPSKQED